MSTVEQIEAAIQELPREDFFRLREWLERHFEDQWDKQIEDDAKTGRLAALAQKAVSEHRAGRSTPFPADEK